MAAPSMNAPNTAWIPTESVNQAPNARAASMEPSIHGGNARPAVRHAALRRPSSGRAARTTTQHVDESAHERAATATSVLPVKLPRTIARMIHAAASSIAPAASASVPTPVPAMPRS